MFRDAVIIQSVCDFLESRHLFSSLFIPSFVRGDPTAGSVRYAF